MKKILLKHESPTVCLDYNILPLIYVINISVISKDNNAKHRFENASIIAEFHSSADEKYVTPIILPLDSRINNPHKKYNIGQYLKYGQGFPHIMQPKGETWKLCFIANNFVFQPDEEIIIEIMDNEELIKRIDDWKLRIEGLYNSISDWINSSPEYKLLLGRSMIMYEELMVSFGIPEQEIPTADIFLNNKVILSIKPKGLWTIGVNGVIDLLSKLGSQILVDTAGHFAPPQWHILEYAVPKNKFIPFNKESILELLENLR